MSAGTRRTGDGCPGGVTLQGRTVGLCIRCTHLGGREMAPAVDLVDNVAACPNFHQLAMGRLNPAGQSPSLDCAA